MRQRRIIAIASALLGYSAIASTAGDQMRLESPTVAAGATLPVAQAYDRLGCRGKNVSPALRWSGAPAGTRSFAVTVFDPDAPTGAGWWHWLVYDIPPSVSDLPEGAGSPGGKLPPGSVQGHNDFGSTGYGGPCPPPGDKPHRYVFTIYALKTDSIEAPPGSSPARIGPVLDANALAKGSFTALYGR
jgi:Raf kinase inhibitor-like YbhB/YbcL family protein